MTIKDKTCWLCPDPKTGHWLCDGCAKLAASYVGRPALVKPGADEELDRSCQRAGCERVCDPQDGRLVMVEAAHLSTAMTPFFSFKEGGGAPCEYVELLVPARIQLENMRNR
jgi:hypothetical protein